MWCGVLVFYGVFRVFDVQRCSATVACMQFIQFALDDNRTAAARHGMDGTTRRRTCAALRNTIIGIAHAVLARAVLVVVPVVVVVRRPNAREMRATNV